MIKIFATYLLKALCLYQAIQLAVAGYSTSLKQTTETEAKM
jgi:hypothetical protein